MNKIELREINKLIRESFFIPTYQRGYRWDKQQVMELLNDLYEFKGEDNSFYCLQPIVVKKRQDGRFDVIDGQQRLTTIYIIQKCMKKRTFKIEYERKGSAEFLDKIDEYVNNDEKQTIEKNIDYFFMSAAYQTIQDWINKKIEENQEYDLEDDFNRKISRTCKVIWYEVDDTADAESIFTRLNIGKIPLTNAELIKALFLQKSNFKEAQDFAYLRQLEIANEWDNIEKVLQDDKVWYFINPSYEEPPATRIEYIFDVISNKTSKDCSNYTFLKFSELIKSEGILAVWQKIKEHFRIIMEWYSSQEKDGKLRLFHLIGFLTSSKSGVTVKDLIKEYYSKKYKKDEFLNRINAYIGQMFNGVKIDDLSYDDPKDQDNIRNILLLFNVLTVMNKSSSYSRFPFDSYNKNKKGWSLEHIHAQNTEGLGNDKNLQLAWIDDHLKSFRQFPNEHDKVEYAKVVEKLESVDRENLNKDTFDALFNELCTMIKDDYGVDLHKIDNLALLDVNANSSIGNNFFDVKRTKIIEKDRNGEFIPVCTRNVFLKYYSSDPSQIRYWSETDRKDYLNTIKATLAQYIDDVEKGENFDE